MEGIASPGAPGDLTTVSAHQWRAGLAIRQVAWATASGVVLGTLAALIAAMATSAHVLLGMVLAGMGGMALGLFCGGMIGLVTAMVHVAVVARLPVARRPRAYRWGMSLLGAAIGMSIVRLTLAAIFFLGRGAEGAGWYWELGWSLEEYPTLTAFLTVVVSPTLLAGLGTWWATRRVAAWYIRVPLRHLPVGPVSDPARRGA